MNAKRRMRVDENAELFEANIDPLFDLLAARPQEHLLETLGNSLKKALLLMAIDRYGCSRTRVSRALGISPAKLEKELAALRPFVSGRGGDLTGIRRMSAAGAPSVCAATNEMP